MMPKLISWNVRGLNEVSKRLGVRHLLRGWGANLVCLQETKMEFISRAVIRSLWGGNHVGYQFLGLSGVSGGVLVMWDTRVLEMKEVSIGVFSIAISFKNCEDGFQWMFTGVYGPNSDDSRVGLWDERLE